MYVLSSITRLSYWSLLLFFMGILCSFSAIPVPSANKTAPPIEKKASSKRQKRLNKRYNKLHKRFDAAKNSKQRLRLQKKIRQVERQQVREGTAFWGILGMVIGIIALLAFPFLSYLILRQAGALPGAVSILAFLLVAFVGLFLSIFSLVKHKKDPKRYTKKGFGLAGIIIGSIVCAILLFFFVIALIMVVPLL